MGKPCFELFTAKMPGLKTIKLSHIELFDKLHHCLIELDNGSVTCLNFVIFHREAWIHGIRPATIDLLQRELNAAITFAHAGFNTSIQLNARMITIRTKLQTATIPTIIANTPAAIIDTTRVATIRNGDLYIYGNKIEINHTNFQVGDKDAFRRFRQMRLLLILDAASDTGIAPQDLPQKLQLPHDAPVPLREEFHPFFGVSQVVRASPGIDDHLLSLSQSSRSSYQPSRCHLLRRHTHGCSPRNFGHTSSMLRTSTSSPSLSAPPRTHATGPTPSVPPVHSPPPRDWMLETAYRKD